MVRLFPISDLHLNFSYTINGAMKSPFNPDVMKKNFSFLHTGDDTVLLACGDIGERGQGLTWCERMLTVFPHLHIVYVPGNHEFYGSNMQNTILDLLIAGTTHPRLHVLDGVNKCEWEMRDEVTNKLKLRVVGGTLWTDYLGGNKSVMEKALEDMNDYSNITFGEHNKPIRPEHILQIHYQTRKYMFAKFNKHANWSTEMQQVPLVAVSHHCPYLPVNFGKGEGYYCTDMTEQFMNSEILPKYWFSGHTHESRVYRAGFGDRTVEFISNQVGYPTQTETGYTKHCIIEV